MKTAIEQQRYTCAIGALQTVVAIPKAVPILHSGPGCGSMVAGFFERSTGYAGGNTTPCTNFSESDVVFGGVDKLKNVIKNTYKILDTELQVVLTGCTADIVGDDTGSVVSEFADEGKPIVYVETAGFKYTNYVSHSLIVNAIVDQFVDRNYNKSAKKNHNLVNVFASIPYQDPFWKGNLNELKRLLEGLGLQVNILFGPNSGGVEEWKTIPEANFNILVSPWYGLEIVKHLKNQYNQPYYHFKYIPIGGNETYKFLNEVIDFSKSNGVNIDFEAAHKFIEKQNQAFYEEIDNLATFLMEFRYGLPNYVHIIHDSGYVLGISKFLLHEVGIVPKEVVATEKVPKEFQNEINDILSNTSYKRTIPLTFTQDGGEAQEIIRKSKHHGKGLLIGSGWDKSLAKEKEFTYLSAAVPSPYRLVLTTGYLGFTGGLRLIEDIFYTVLEEFQ